MKNKFCITILILLLGVFSPLFAQNSFTDSVDNNSWAYDALHYLLLENGYANTADSKPLTKNEMRLHFSGLDENLFTASGSYEIFDKLNQFLYTDPQIFSSDIFSFDANLKVSLEGRYKNRYDSEPRSDEILYYNKMNPLISVPLTLRFSSYASLYTSLDFKKNFGATSHSYPFINIPLAGNAFDTNFPSSAGLVLGNSFFTFRLGRGPLQRGRTLSGSMILSDTADRLDYLTFSLFTKNVRASLTTIELNPSRFIFLHEISFTPWKFISFQLSEGMSLNSSFDPRYLNPMMILHNYAGWKDTSYVNSGSNKTLVGTQFSAGVSIVPIPRLRLYGQFVMNQFQTPFEKSQYGEAAKGTPNSLGGLTGVEYIHPLLGGYITTNLEAVYANPWLYILENRAISFIHERKELESTLSYNDSRISTWLGNPLGPDTIACFFKVGLTKPHLYGYSLLYRFVCKGENERAFINNKQHYPSEGNLSLATIKTPSGAPTFFHTIKISGYHTFIENLSLTTDVTWTTAKKETQKHMFSLELGVSYKLK